MRHRVSGRKLSRTASHRKALMRSLATELIRHKRIRTTEAKAKEASKYVEGLIARAKRAHLKEEAGDPRDHSSRRHIARDIQDKGVLRELFEVVAPKVAARSGGFTRVVRTGRRQGDGAEMAVLELVDYNLEQDESAVRSQTKRTISRAERVRRSQQKAAAAEADDTAPDTESEAVEEAAEAPSSEASSTAEADVEDSASTEATTDDAPDVSDDASNPSHNENIDAEPVPETEEVETGTSPVSDEDIAANPVDRKIPNEGDDAPEKSDDDAPSGS